MLEVISGHIDLQTTVILIYCWCTKPPRGGEDVLTYMYLIPLPMHRSLKNAEGPMEPSSIFFPMYLVGRMVGMFWCPCTAPPQSFLYPLHCWFPVPYPVSGAWVHCFCDVFTLETTHTWPCILVKRRRFCLACFAPLPLSYVCTSRIGFSSNLVRS